MLRRVRNALAEKQAVDAAGLIQSAVFKASAERVRRIRAGLAAAGAKPYIQTVWGCGYKWVE